MRSILLSFAVLVATGSAALAAPAQWTVDQAKSTLGFHVSAKGQAIDGTFPAFGALIAFDPADLNHSSAKITIDMTAAQSGNATRDAMLPLPAWFNAKDFPKAHFNTTTITAKGGDKYEASGTLSIKGVAKPVVLPFTLTISGNTAHMVGETTIKRLDFKVGEGKEYESADTLALEVKVSVDLTATRKP